MVWATEPLAVSTFASATETIRPQPANYATGSAMWRAGIMAPCL